MSRVEKRKVSRWFVDGRGYASESQAYLALAKKALNREILSVAIPRMLGGDSKDVIHAAFSEKFPVCDNPHGCDKSGSMYCHSNKAFCNYERWLWLRKKAKEIKDADVA